MSSELKTAEERAWQIEDGGGGGGGGASSTGASIGHVYSK